MTDKTTSKDEYLSKLKQLKLAQAGVPLADTERLITLITVDDEQAIEKQAKTIAQDLADTPINTRDNNGTWTPF